MSQVRNNTEISVVIPSYRCADCIKELYERLVQVLEKMSKDFEIIFVNDGSPEPDWDEIKNLSAKDNRITGLNLSRNYGQHTAITAGLDASSGKWIVVMDCDLQDRPEEIQKLYEKAGEGYHIVLARRVERKDGFLKKLSSKLFYKALSYLTDTEQDESIGNFGVYSRKAIDAVISIRENMRYFPVIVRWAGFRSVSVAVDHDAGKKRKSSYSFGKLLSLALDVMIATSDKPLKLVVKLGLVISFSSFIFAVYLLVKTFRGDFIVMGWPSLIVSIWLLSGIIISILGMIGLYLGKTFAEVKNKPLYIIDETTADRTREEIK